MKDIENMLNEAKADFDNTEVPNELEGRLFNALNKSTLKARKRLGWIVRAASVLIAFLIIGYNFDTLAFYGKKLMGYDVVMNGTLRQLNELGRGQIIGKSIAFKNGIIFSLDGVMLDENQLLVFYSLKSPKGDADKIDSGSLMYIDGIGGRHMMRNSQGNMNENKTEIKYMASFEPPYFFEKKLDLNFTLSEGNRNLTGKISFALDRNKAMGHTLKKNINEAIDADGTNIRFKSISASPTTTVIEGKIQDIVELAVDQVTGERIRPNNINIKLVANGKELQSQSGGMSTDTKGITFHSEYDALPQDLKSLQIELVSFSADHDVKKQFDIDKNLRDREIDVLGQKLQINKVAELNGDTYITITTQDKMVLTKVQLIMDGKQVKLEETISDTYNKHSDGIITHTRILHFPGIGENLKLDIQRMAYEKSYNKIIEIPVD